MVDERNASGNGSGGRRPHSSASTLERARLFVEERVFLAIAAYHRMRRAPAKKPGGFAPSGPARAPAAAAPPPPASADPPASAPAPAATVTDRALASIVEVRQPIRPEFSAGSLISLIPAAVIALLVIFLVVEAAMFLRVMMFGGNPFGAGPPAPRLFLPNPYYRRP